MAAHRDKTRPPLALPCAGAAALAVSLLLLASSAAAQETRTPSNTGALDLRLFRPAVDSKGLFGINASEVLPHLDLSIALVLDYGYGLFPATGSRWTDRDADGAIDAAELHDTDIHLVDHAITANVGFNIGLLNFMAVGFSLPVVILSGPAAWGIDGWEGWPARGADGSHANTPSFAAEHVGDLEVHAKIRFLRVERYPVGLAGIVQLFTPTGQIDRALGSDPGVGLGLTAVLDWAPTDWFLGALNLGARFFFGNQSGYEPLALTDAAGRDFQYGHLFTFGVGASFRLVPERLDAVVELYGNTVFARFFDPRHTPLEAVAGLKIFIERNSYLYVGAGTGAFGDGFSAADARVFGAWIFEPTIGDRDRDGIKDDIDQCPDDPEDGDDFEDLDGCPDPDNDRDGLLDVADGCPLIPEDRDGDADADGCPEEVLGDRDGDTIADDNDACPDDPEDLDGFQDVEGCPDPDNDIDDVRDVVDDCPLEPEDPDGFDDADGCPDIDNDADRILDVDDDCPNEPELYNGLDDADGCPDSGIVVPTTTGFLILEQVQFETDSAVILPDSYDLLDQVAASIQGHPEVLSLEVQGHADERNSDEYNRDLTRDRAHAVVEYLVHHGVEPGRLLAAGYGERCPIDPAHTPAAWDRNRRVEFKILRTTTGTPDAERICPAGLELAPPVP
ncbi:MAG: OmpA family protein [Deltaproteobacteria bacterium]|nr:OmpA family protein [Deltaproteobacteria bacterium]